MSEFVSLDGRTDAFPRIDFPEDQLLGTVVVAVLNLAGTSNENWAAYQLPLSEITRQLQVQDTQVWLDYVADYGIEINREAAVQLFQRMDPRKWRK